MTYFDPINWFGLLSGADLGSRKRFQFQALYPVAELVPGRLGPFLFPDTGGLCDLFRLQKSVGVGTASGSKNL